MSDPVHHPAHYGGADDPYEAIKVIEAWGLGFHLGNVVKYIARAGRKGSALEDLRKARWYLNRLIAWEGRENVLPVIVEHVRGGEPPNGGGDDE